VVGRRGCARLVSAEHVGGTLTNLITDGPEGSATAGRAREQVAGAVGSGRGEWVFWSAAWQV
jgi:hypothetical protein